MTKGSVGKRLRVSAVLSLCLLSQPAESTPPPERPPGVEGECPQAFALPAGYAPPEGLIDPATGKSVCGGVLLPTSLTAYYIELDSWKDLAVAEMEVLEAERPTFWGKWGERIQWAAIGVTATVILSSTF
jgi:hypothetical protein